MGAEIVQHHRAQPNPTSLHVLDVYPGVPKKIKNAVNASLCAFFEAYVKL